MSAVQKVFVKYRQMRHSGLEAKSVLDSLSDDIEMLSGKERQELSGHLRALETEIRSAAVPATGKTPTEPHKRAPQSSSIRAISTGVAAPPGGEAVTCRYCGKQNKPGELMCASCGRLVLPAKTPGGTQKLDQPSDTIVSSDYFGPDSLLILKVRHTGHIFEIRPQSQSEDIVIGRSAVGSAMMPDVDLKEQGAERQGVSRLHISLRYDTAHHTLSVLDMESANGSFINGQRIHPQEVRLLRDGDELHLGKLALKVSFAHGK